MSLPAIKQDVRRSWILQVTFLCVILGVLLALSLQTQQQLEVGAIPIRYPVLATQYRMLQVTSDSTIARLRHEVQVYKETLAHPPKNESPKIALLNRQLEDARAFGGLQPVEGPGVIVTLQDSPKARQLAKAMSGGQEGTPEYQNQLANFLVHDVDVNGVVNELKAAGAEAICVNDQRLVATSGIRCQGALCYISGQPTGGTAPYIIQAIGSPVDLKQALLIPGGYLDTSQLSRYPGMVKIDTSDHLLIPAYSGSTEFRYALPATDEKTAHPSLGPS